MKIKSKIITLLLALSLSTGVTAGATYSQETVDLLTTVSVQVIDYNTDYMLAMCRAARETGWFAWAGGVVAEYARNDKLCRLGKPELKTEYFLSTKSTDEAGRLMQLDGINIWEVE